MPNMNSWLIEPQPRLDAGGLLVLLVLGSLAAPFSLDMYTPAVPSMAEYFSTTPDLVNVTLMGYVLFMAFGLLVFGPLSDKYGRKPVLVAGMASYMLASIFCTLSVNIWMLICGRIVQALGSGAMASVCTAIVKDAVREEYREKMLSIMQAMFVIGPAGAPIVGAAVLKFTDWHGTFWTLAVISAIELCMALMYKETLKPSERGTGTVMQSIGRLGVVARNRAFMVFLLVGSAFEIGYMSYVSVGSYIYVDHFGLSPFAYSLFFAAAALVGGVGPVAWLKLSQHVTVKWFTSVALVVSLGLGLIVLFTGHLNPFLFCGVFLVFVFFESAVRPYNFNVLLAQQDNDTGSASALINFVRTMLGVVGMTLVMLPFSNYIVAVGTMMVLGIALSLGGWVWLLRSKLILRGVKESEEPESML